MKLDALFNAAGIAAPRTSGAEVSGGWCDSRQVTAGGVCGAIPGECMDGAAFARDALEVAPIYGAAEEGVVAEDLFLYPAGRITLEPDQVAYVPLFTETVPYKHLYQWDIPRTMDETGRSLSPPSAPDGRERE